MALRGAGRGRAAPPAAVLLDTVVLALALLALGPALAPGFVLSYDMVWMPDLAVTSAGWGWVEGVPRAVPSDQVVALLDELVPGAVLQRVVLLGALVAAGAGAHRLARDAPLAARLLVAGVATWNPFVAERLLVGHWPVLLGYGVLPWLLLAGRRLRAEGGGLPPHVAALAAVGSLSASAGLGTAVALALLVGVAGRAGRRAWAGLVAVVVAANAPWVVAGGLAGGVTRSDPVAARVAAEVFAARGDDVPTPLAVAGLGGIWNTAVVPQGLGLVASVLWAAVVLGGVAVVLAGRAGVPAAERWALVGAAGVAWAVALVSWAAPGVNAWLATHVPGGGVARDGARLLGLVVPAAVVGLAAAAGEGLARVRPAVPGRVALTVAAALLPVALLPGLAGGATGDLRGQRYPAAYPAAAQAWRTDAAARDLEDGLVVSLPFAAFRAPAWNGGRTVLDPVPRVVGGADVVTDDALVVGGRTVAGEDPRAARVAAALALDGAAHRTTALRELGVAYVLRARGPDVDAAPERLAPTLEETVVAAGDELVLARLDGAVAARPDDAPGPVATAALAVAWTAFGALPLLAAGAGARAAARAVRDRRDERPAVRPRDV
ncbi:hypothetical protein INN71_07720 [Nocardioides sp. ChNu-153]|uniref:hypothetical protein n=1 Tax=unclassified Nocardioides TaxID=2615069 RepID=UPI002405662B|nr:MULTISPECIES: hypothetical protein [unclassified Nocardioides]MDF9715607.1 hypothetical protein [Nocardioides sp. ChNu-99]MDN7121279.1 hypothetical protein [Nocardioides sp. ChNu-153]